MSASLTRRTALGLLGVGGLAAVVSACDASDLDPRSDPPTPTVTQTLQQPAPADQQADEETLLAALGETATTLAFVEAVLRRHPSLRADLREVAAMHRTHRDELTAAASDAGRPGAPGVPVPRRASAALALVRATEETTRGRYQGWALEARSGAFARLLASMSAAVGQRLSVLPDGVEGRA